MTREEFLAKHPKPWSFERTDRSGTGVVTDANGHRLVILYVDAYADEEDYVPAVFCELENEHGNGDIVGPARDERDMLIDILIAAKEEPK